MEGFELPEGNSKPQIPTNQPRTGWFNKNTNHNYHYYPPEVPRSKWVTKLSYGVAFAGFCISGYACLQYVEANRIALENLNAQKRSNEEMASQTIEFRRQNDLECLEQKLITKEKYCSRHPLDCQKSNIHQMSTEEKAARMKASKKAGMPGIKVTENNHKNDI